MPNELIIILNLIVLYLAVLLWYFLFGTKGLYCFSIFATIVANIEVLILVNAFGMEQTLGNVLFATTFLITDIVSEVNGKKESQKVVNTNILTSVLFVVITQTWLLYTPSSNDFAFSSIKTLFATTPRVVFASLIVYAVSQKFDVWLYHKWWDFTNKRFKNKEKYLWLRNNGSTLVSQGINAVLYNLIAFGGTYSWETVGSIIATSYIIFIFTSLLDTPIVYLARRIYHKKFEGKNEDEVTNNYASVTFGVNFKKKKLEKSVNTEGSEANFVTDSGETEKERDNFDGENAKNIDNKLESLDNESGSEK